MRALPRYIAGTLAAMALGLQFGTPAAAAAAAATTGSPSGASRPVPSRGGRPTRGPWLIRPFGFGRPILIPAFGIPSPQAIGVALIALVAAGVIISNGNYGFGDDSPLVVNVNRGSSPVQTASAPANTSVPSGNTAPASGNSGGGGGASTSKAPTTGSTGSTGSTTSTGATSTTGTTTTPTNTALPPIKHVWVIQMGDASFSQTFSTASTDTYLNTTLGHEGEVVPEVYAATSSDLGNEDALISGQGPTGEILENCPTYDSISPGTQSPTGITLGSGCVFPTTTETLFDELSANNETWKVYVQGQGSGPDASAAVRAAALRAHGRTIARRGHAHTIARRGHARTVARRGHARTVARRGGPRAEKQVTPPTQHYGSASLGQMLWDAAHSSSSKSGERAAQHSRSPKRDAGAVKAPVSCGHPTVGAADPYEQASTTDEYVTFRNPAVYFQSITLGKDCDDDDVGLNSLAGDLKSASTTPTLSMIYPGPCDDGSDTGPGTACPGVPDVPNPADDTTKFLGKTIAEITASPAYAGGKGMILVLFDNTPQTGNNETYESQASCCSTPAYPNVINTFPVSSPTTTSSTPTAGNTGATTTAGSTGATTTAGSTGTTTTAGSTGAASPSGATGSTGAASPYTEDTTTTTVTPPSTTTAGNTGTTTSGCTTTGTAPTGATTTATSTNPNLCAPAGVTTDQYGNPLTGGGGQIGMLAISKWVTPEAQDTIDSYNDFNILASLEKLFGVSALGYSQGETEATFGSFFYSQYHPPATG